MKRELGRVPFHSDFLHVSRFTFHASRFPCRGEAGLLGNTLQIRVHLCSSVVEPDGACFGQDGSGYKHGAPDGAFWGAGLFVAFGWSEVGAAQLRRSAMFIETDSHARAKLR